MLLTLVCAGIGACTEEPEAYIRECGRAPWPMLGGGHDAAFRMCAPGPDDPDAEFELIAPVDWPTRGMVVGPDDKLFFLGSAQLNELDLQTLERRTRNVADLLPPEYATLPGDEQDPSYGGPWTSSTPVWCEPGVVALSVSFQHNWTNVVVSDELEPLWIDRPYRFEEDGGQEPLWEDTPSVISCGAEETLYMPRMDGVLRKYTAAGELLWELDVISSVLPVVEVDGVMYQVRLVDPVPGAVGYATSAELVAADPTSGDTRWSAGLDDDQVFSLSAGADGDLIVVSDTSLSAIRSDGSLRWRLPHTDNGSESARWKPAIHRDGAVMITAWNRFMRVRAGQIESQLLTGKQRGYDVLTDPVGRTYLLACGPGCELIRFPSELPLLADRRWSAPAPSWVRTGWPAMGIVTDANGAIIVEHASGIYRLKDASRTAGRQERE